MNEEPMIVKELAKLREIGKSARPLGEKAKYRFDILTDYGENKKVYIEVNTREFVFAYYHFDVVSGVENPIASESFSVPFEDITKIDCSSRKFGWYDEGSLHKESGSAVKGAIIGGALGGAPGAVAGAYAAKNTKKDVGRIGGFRSTTLEKITIFFSNRVMIQQEDSDHGDTYENITNLVNDIKAGKAEEIEQQDKIEKEQKEVEQKQKEAEQKKKGIIGAALFAFLIVCIIFLIMAINM